MTPIFARFLDDTARRQKALEKLHTFTPHIGYPDKWRDYSALAIDRNDLVGDIERSDVFEWNHRSTASTSRSIATNGA